jgi:hypothetical protein
LHSNEFNQEGQMSDFYGYFKENMEGLGLPAPDSLFGNAQLAIGNAAVLVGLVEKFGTAVTVRELIVAGTRLEQLAAAGSMAASYYVGAVIGSLAVATGRSISGGTSLADVLFEARRHQLSRPWLVQTLQRHPVMYKTGAGNAGLPKQYANIK